MSNYSISEKPDAPKLRAEAIIAYLKEHPDFFRRHPEVVEELSFEHGGDNVASLLERQIEILRNKNADLSSKIETLINTARANENSSFALHRFSLALLQSLASDGSTTAHQGRVVRIEEACQYVLHKAFSDVQITFHWFQEAIGELDRLSLISRNELRIASLVRRIFSDGKPYCGPFSAAERAILFSEFNKHLGSVVVIPISEPRTAEQLGLIVLVSHNTDKFVSGKGTIFLTLLKQLIEYCLYSRAPEAAEEE